MRSYFALVLLVLVAQPTLQFTISKSVLHSYSGYVTWKERFGISYETMSEDAYRFGVWLINMGKIEHHNRYSRASYTMGENQFTGMTREEFKQYVHQINIDKKEPRRASSEQDSVRIEIDWTTKGAVNPVRNEGKCGASYIYAATGSIEGQYFLKKGSLQTLSWQQMIDCTTSYGNHGCNGGYIANCFKYAHDIGLVTESSYPYRGVQGKCLVSSGPLKIANYTEAIPGNCKSVETLLALGPVAVAINTAEMQSYHSGIFDYCPEEGEYANSGALLVGQTSASWKVQMNFGTTWGVSGYVYLPPGNMCNVCDMASQAYL